MAGPVRRAAFIRFVPGHDSHRVAADGCRHRAVRADDRCDRRLHPNCRVAGLIGAASIDRCCSWPTPSGPHRHWRFHWRREPHRDWHPRPRRADRGWAGACSFPRRRAPRAGRGRNRRPHLHHQSHHRIRLRRNLRPGHRGRLGRSHRQIPQDHWVHLGRNRLRQPRRPHREIHAIRDPAGQGRRQIHRDRQAPDQVRPSQPVPVRLGSEEVRREGRPAAGRVGRSEKVRANRPPARSPGPSFSSFLSLSLSS